VTSPLEDWTDEATIAWKKTYFDKVKKRKKAKVNHFACCTEDFFEPRDSGIEVAPKKTPPPSYSETYSNYCLHDKV